MHAPPGKGFIQMTHSRAYFGPNVVVFLHCLASGQRGGAGRPAAHPSGSSTEVSSHIMRNNPAFCSEMFGDHLVIMLIKQCRPNT